MPSTDVFEGQSTEYKDMLPSHIQNVLPLKRVSKITVQVRRINRCHCWYG